MPTVPCAMRFAVLSAVALMQPLATRAVVCRGWALQQNGTDYFTDANDACAGLSSSSPSPPSVLLSLPTLSLTPPIPPHSTPLSLSHRPSCGRVDSIARHLRERSWNLLLPSLSLSLSQLGVASLAHPVTHDPSLSVVVCAIAVRCQHTLATLPLRPTLSYVGPATSEKNINFF
jgi:hypothetical protein